ncbi:MAG: SDR family NAD(P)-dependent oxidoreductase [Planctomycetes bacterium]|nr:SDR family NAD(P)-dependent oxidoreductase [Planctomycetota bacterium]
MKLLEGKVAIITGAGGGLGRSHALAFAAEGAKIVVNDPGVARDGSGGAAKTADAVVEEIKKAGGQAVANYDSVADGGEKIVKTAVDAFGKVDILVNNAGILRDKTIHNMTDEMWDLVLAVHLRGTFVCTRAAAKVMKEKGTGGRIINTTSVAGLKGNFGQSNYSAAKAGIYGFTLTAAMELAKDGITVNAIAPIAKTRMTEDIESIPSEYRPEEVSPVVVFFASDLSKDLSGRIIGVHGRHLFEYKMEISEGKEKKEAWTPAEINEWIRTPEAPKAAPAAAAAGGPSVASIFKGLAGAFDPEKSAGWDSLMHFAVAGGGDWTVEVKNKAVRVAEGKPEAPTCVISMDADTLIGMVQGRVKGDAAFMSGKLKATKVPDLGKFGKAFDFKKIKLDGPAAAPAAGGGGSIASVFQSLAGAFDSEKSAGWDTLIHFAVTGAGDWTVEVKDKKVRVAAGKPDAPTSVITTDANTLLGMVEGRIKGDMAFMSGKLKATKVPDLAKFGKAFDFKKIKVGAAPAAAAAPKSLDLRALLSRLTSQFLPDKAAGFNGTLLFKVDGQAATLEIKDKTVSVKPPVPLATCVITTDGATLAGIVDASVDVQKAFGEGKIKVTHPPGWMKFRQIFTFAPEKGLHRALIGKRFDGAALLIRPERLAAYDAAVEDAGSLIFPVTLGKDPFVKLFEDPDFNGELSRMVHGEQEFTFRRPLKAWDLITPRGRVRSIEDKSSGQILNFEQTLFCEGEPLVQMTSGLFFRGESKGDKPAVPAAAEKPPPPADSTHVLTVPSDLPRRYAEASGDMNPIHVDKGFAQSAGFKDVILHGLGTLALVSKALPKTLSALQVRFAKPVYPNDVLTTSFWKKEGRISFQTVNVAGEAVLTRGLATLL